MTTLPERLLAHHAALGDMSTGLTGHTVVLNARRAAEIHALLREAAQALQAAPEGGDSKEFRLWDSQWVNVVNHDNCYRDWSMEDAIAHAVKMTEDYMRRNIEENKFPPPRHAGLHPTTEPTK